LHGSAAQVAWQQQQQQMHVQQGMHQRVATAPLMQQQQQQAGCNSCKVQQLPHAAPPQAQQQPPPFAKYSVSWLLQKIEMEKYAPLFQHHEIDSLVMLCKLTKEDMVKLLGLPLGAAVKISTAIEYISQRSGVQSL
jgi:hypothetical protein